MLFFLGNLAIWGKEWGLSQEFGVLHVEVRRMP